ncbi:MAG: calcium-binding protein [Pseudomonadota bacterium]
MSYKMIDNGYSSYEWWWRGTYPIEDYYYYRDWNFGNSGKTRTFNYDDKVTELDFWGDMWGKDYPNVYANFGDQADFFDMEADFEGIDELDLHVDLGDGDNYFYFRSEARAGGGGTGESFVYVDSGNGDDYVYFDTDDSDSRFDINITGGDNYIQTNYRGAGDITTGGGDDYIVHNANGYLNVNAGDGDNTIIANGTRYADDTITSGSGDDIIYAGKGTDTIDAGGGNDYIDIGDFGDGVEEVTLGAGADTLYLTGTNTTTTYDSSFTDGWKSWSSSVGAWQAQNFGMTLVSGMVAGTAIMKANPILAALYSNAAGYASWMVWKAIGDAMSNNNKDGGYTTSVTNADDNSAFVEVHDFDVREDSVILPVLYQNKTVMSTVAGQEAHFDLPGSENTSATYLKMKLDSVALSDFRTAIDLSGTVSNDVIAASVWENIFTSIMWFIKPDESNSNHDEDVIAFMGSDPDSYDEDSSDVLDITGSDDDNNNVQVHFDNILTQDDSHFGMLGGNFGYSILLSEAPYAMGSNNMDVFELSAVADDHDKYYVAGFDGDDYLKWTQSDKTLVFNGGDGSDTIDFSDFYDSFTNDNNNVEFDDGLHIDLTNDFVTDPGNNQQTYDGSIYAAGDAHFIISSVENVYGTAYNDTFTGSNDNNWFAGMGGNDTIDGGYGIDTVYISSTDTITADSHNYEFNYNSATGQGVVTHNNDSSSDVTASNVEFYQFEVDGEDVRFAFVDPSSHPMGSQVAVYALGASTNFEGANENDMLFGTEGDNKIFGRGGDDIFIGAGGDDDLRGHTSSGSSSDDGDTAYYFGGVAEFLIYRDSSDSRLTTDVIDNSTSYYDEGTDIVRDIEYLAFSDGAVIDLTGSGRIFYGTTDASNNKGTQNAVISDWIFGNAGNDTLTGFGGDDHLIGGTGNDTIYGNWSGASGTGTDTAYYAGSVAEYLVELDESSSSLSTSVIHNSGAAYDEGTDQLMDIDFIHFGDGVVMDLHLSGSINSGSTSGSNNNGETNDDWRFGNAGDDTVRGREGDDHLVGGTGDDDIYGDDEFAVGVNTGFDTAYYAGSVAEYVLDATPTTLADITITDGATSDYDDGTDQLYDIDNIHFGDGVIIDLNSYTMKTDDGTGGGTFSGDSSNNWVFGNAGNDAIRGGGGNDHIVGGTGNDTIYGHWEGNADDSGAEDTVYYADVLANYEISVGHSSLNGEFRPWATITDTNTLGTDNFDEGTDKVWDVDYFVFDGHTYTYTDLAGMFA